MTMLPKVLISDNVHPLLLNGLQEAGYQCDYQPKILLKDVLDVIHIYQGIVINSKIIVDKTFLDKAVQLKFVARLGSGLEIIDVDYAAQKGVAVHRAPDGNCDAVAEHGLGMLLMLANKMIQGNQQVLNMSWNREACRGWELMGKTIGIIGYGYTGKAFAKRLQGFDMNILVYDKYQSDFQEPYVKECEMKDIFEKASIVSFHLPLTKETIGLANADYWSRFTNDIVVLNTSRGSVIDTKDLIKALDSGKIMGACLDVFENEKPLTFSKEEQQYYQNLYNRDNVVLSPHVAGWTVESKYRLAQLLLDRILKQ